MNAQRYIRQATRGLWGQQKLPSRTSLDRRAAPAGRTPDYSSGTYPCTSGMRSRAVRSRRTGVTLTKPACTAP